MYLAKFPFSEPGMVTEIVIPLEFHIIYCYYLFAYSISLRSWISLSIWWDLLETDIRVNKGFTKWLSDFSGLVEDGNIIDM